MIYYQIYNTVNKINNKNYIGQHKQESREKDEYLGSGLHFKRAIKKYGINSFEKTVLDVCETQEQANLLEKKYIAFYKLAGLCQYNIAEGGQGGIIYELHPMLGKKGKDNPNYGQKRHAHSERMKGAGNPMYGKTGEQSTCFGRTGEKHPMFNKEHLEETKKQIGETLKLKYANGERKKPSMEGEKNPAYGRHWYNNGTEQRFCFECPEGFNPGMLK